MKLLLLAALLVLPGCTLSLSVDESGQVTAGVSGSYSGKLPVKSGYAK